MNSRPSSVLKKVDQPIKVEQQLQLPTWSIIVFLVVFLFVLKSFIYIKDQKRHGK